MKTFEKPLTAAEERFYLQKYKEGDLEAKNILVERNLRLVAHMVKHYSYCEKDMEDLISIGTIGLIKAVNTFDCNKGSRLATYAAKCIDNELLMTFRSNKKKSREVSLQEPIGTDKEGNEISLIDVMESNEKDFLEGFILQTNIEWLYDAIDKILNHREKDIIIRRYGLFGHKEVTQRELADEMNISRSYVSRIEKKAVEKLREYYEGIIN